MKIDQKSIQILFKSAFDDSANRKVLLKLGANPLTVDVLSYDYGKHKHIVKNCIKESVDQTNILSDFIKLSKHDLSKNKYINEYVQKNGFKYKVNTKRYTLKKKDFDYLLTEVCINNLGEKENYQVLKNIIQSNKLTIDYVSDASYYSKNLFLEICDSWQVNCKQIFEIYKIMNKPIKTKRIEFVLFLFEMAFYNSKDIEKSRLFMRILEDQIKQGLDLKTIKRKCGNLFHILIDAGYNLNLELINFLTSNGISLTAINSSGDTPLHMDMDFYGREKDALGLITYLIDKKIDLNLENAKGKSILLNLLECNLQIKHYTKMLKDIGSTKKAGIVEISAIVARDRESKTLLSDYLTRGALEDYKILEYVYPKYNRLKMIPFNRAKELVQLPPVILESLKNNSLKDYLGDVFGVTSSNMTNLFLTECKKREDQFDFIKAGYILSNIFVKSDVRNPDYMLELLNKQYVVTGLRKALNSNSIEQCVGFFVRNFSQQQSKILIESMMRLRLDRCWGGDGDVVYDSINMYWQFPDQLTPMIKDLKFSNINTFKKIHDYLSRETAKLEQKPFDLNQEKITPELNDIHLKGLGVDGFTIYVAQNNYDLINWGSSLHNCIGGGGYASDAKKGESLILGILHDNEIKYCVEIHNHKLKEKRQLGQIEGLGRCSLPTPLFNAFKKTLVKANIIK